MELSSVKASRTVRSPFASPSTGFLLRRRILECIQETGSPASIRVRVDGKLFNLHKDSMISKSGYFKKALVESSDIELPEKFPGGSEIFEMVALFSYDHPLTLDPFNISALRCAAEALEMTEDHANGNLQERSDLYLNQVVLQSWDDTLIALQKCQTLLPKSEELLIVSRCVESLAFMACMEILDPEQGRDRPVITFQALACGLAKEMAGKDLWIKDLIALPFEFFKRIIGSLRRQGMKDKYVSPLIVLYANKWVLSKKTHKFWEHTSEHNGVDDANNKVSMILQGVVELLPMGDEHSRAVPVSFYLALLSRSLALRLSNNHKLLEAKVASLLHLARAEEFLFPDSGIESIASTAEVRTMERIVSIRVSMSKADIEDSMSNFLTSSSVVAELWDQYLYRIAIDPKMEPRRFMELIEVIPMADREKHDHLYRAMNTFLLEHPNLSTDEKASVCKHLNCQKLSQEACIEAVQSEQMPLRLIVQALFVQQLRTHQAFKNCSDSFRYIHSGEFSGSLLRSQNQGETPYEQATMPLGSLLQKDIAIQRSELTKTDYESASFRLQSLEEELMSLKHSLQRQKAMEGRTTVVKKRKSLGHAGSCIGALTWGSHRKYASRLLKVFGRINILRKGKSKIKQGVSGLSNGSIACRSKSLHELYDC